MGDPPQDPDESEAAEEPLRAPASYPDFGIHVAALPTMLASRLAARGIAGVIVESVEASSPAEGVGIASGMIIGQIGSDRVTDVESYRKAMKSVSKERSASLLLHSPKKSAFVVLTID